MLCASTNVAVYFIKYIYLSDLYAAQQGTTEIKLRKTEGCDGPCH